MGRQPWRVAVAGVIAAALSIGSSGCRDRNEDDGGKAAIAPAGREAEEDLLSRRDMLLATRGELRSRRAELAEQREVIRVQGGDTSALDKETQELIAKENEVAAQEKALLDKLMSERQALLSAVATSSASSAPAREASVAAREKDLARRETKLAEREVQLAGREEGLASKWKDACAAGGTTTIVQTLDVKGTKYTKKDVEPLLARARSEMNKKGLLRIDLPEPVRDLETESTRAMEKGDYGQARFAAAQLLGTVRAMKVDKPFIAAKISRLNTLMKSKKLSATVEQLFRDATENVADGNFASANRKLNRIHTQIRDTL